jgi:respiratory burst oxidase
LLYYFSDLSHIEKGWFWLKLQLWQLETLLLQKDTYVNYSQALSYTSQALSQNLAGLRKKSPIRKINSTLRYYLEDNWKRLWVLTLWIGIMTGLFIWKFIQYRNRYVFDVMGYCVTTAKGAAETLKLNMAIILLPVCRNTITWLRNTKAARALPFDDNINFHKVRHKTYLFFYLDYPESKGWRGVTVALAFIDYL